MHPAYDRAAMFDKHREAHARNTNAPHRPRPPRCSDDSAPHKTASTAAEALSFLPGSVLPTFITVPWTTPPHVPVVDLHNRVKVLPAQRPIRTRETSEPRSGLAINGVLVVLSGNRPTPHLRSSICAGRARASSFPFRCHDRDLTLLTVKAPGGLAAEYVMPPRIAASFVCSLSACSISSGTS
jgi:hypothetical protein